MKKEIEQFKKENGNINFTQKEMIMYLIQEVKDMKTIIKDNGETIVENSTNISNIKTYLRGIFIIFSGIIGWIGKKIYGG